MTTKPVSTWSSGDNYEQYMGRWSRRVAAEFVRWLSPRVDLDWADVGSGTGALSATILAACAPRSIAGIDASEAFVAAAREAIGDSRARFETGDAQRLPWSADVFDIAVSGLVLNFVREPEAMAREMARVTKPGGVVAAYVWDYGAMDTMRCFWDAAIAVCPDDAKLNQADLYRVCAPGALASLFEDAGLQSVETRAIEIATVFASFDDYWQPFLGRAGTAPTYLAGLSDDLKDRIRETLRSRLRAATDGSIALRARAWVVRGAV